MQKQIKKQNIHQKRFQLKKGNKLFVFTKNFKNK